MNAEDGDAEAAGTQDSQIYQKNLPIDSIFVLQEQDIVDSYNDSFAVSWRTISQIEEDGRTNTSMSD